jgi:2-polyprenyl-3-methyl-5-hydroxy-6-metoxy-1,4-benzoquinol methylase
MKGQGHFEGSHGDTLWDVRGFQLQAIGWVMQQLNSQPEGLRCLDIGASEGFLGLLPWQSYEGIDREPRHRRVKKMHVENILKDPPLGLAGGGFVDLIVLSHVLEHLDEPGRALGDMREMVDLGGWIFIAVPHAASDWAWEYDDHFWMFNAVTLERLLNRHYFKPMYTVRQELRPDKVEIWMLGRAQ